MAEPITFEGLKFFQSSFKVSEDNADFFRFVEPPKRGVLVELGAGFGLGTVMLAKRRPRLRIVAVEYQPELVKLLRKNLELNGVKNAEVLPCDIRKVKDCLPPDFADAVVSNPPFWRREFLTPEAKKDEVYKRANYEVETPFGAFLEAAKYLLKSSKPLFFMFESARFDEVLKKLGELKFAASRVRFVHPTPYKASNVFFLKAVLGGRGGHLRVEPPLIRNLGFF